MLGDPCGKNTFKCVSKSYILESAKSEGSTGKHGVLTGVKNSCHTLCHFFLLCHVLKLMVLSDPVDRNI